jgi:hypothetical protein
VSTQLDDLYEAFMHAPIDSRAHDKIIGGIIEYLKTVKSDIDLLSASNEVICESNATLLSVLPDETQRAFIALMAKTTPKTCVICQEVEHLPGCPDATQANPLHPADANDYAAIIDAATRLYHAARAIGEYPSLEKLADLDTALESIKPFLVVEGALTLPPEAPR